MDANLRAYLDAHKVENAARNAAAFRRIAAHLDAGHRDPSGNSSATFRKCAERLERIANGRTS